MNRAVITGIGCISSIGLNYNEFCESLSNGLIGETDIQRFDVSSLKHKKAYLIDDFDISKIINKKILNKLQEFEKKERSYLYALAAVEEAIGHSGIDIAKLEEDACVCAAASLTGSDFLEKYLKQLDMGEQPNPQYLLYGVGDLHTFLSRIYNIKGSPLMVSTACASSSNAIGVAYERIRSGESKVVLSGGTDCYTTLVHGGFSALNAITNDGLKPFSEDRSGTVLGEGAAFFIIEELEHAKQRNAKILAEIKGYGISNDAYHITAGLPNGDGLQSAMTQALAEASLSIDEIDYINCHGTGTPTNDTSELNAIEALGFGKSKVNINSLKPYFGHLLAAAGSIEIAGAIYQMQIDTLLPTPFLEEEKKIGLNSKLVSKKKNIEIKNIISNSVGFGGNNASICISKYMGK